MQEGRAKLFLLRFSLILIVCIGLESAGYLGMSINSSSFDWLSNKNYFQIRSMLMGNQNPENFPRYLTLPYLGYIPYPGYKKYGVVQHNEDGYRGHRVPLQKTHKFRILCLGGSTTYGSGVDFPDQTYPAQLEILLSNYINHDSMLKNKYSGAEVINAGLEAGNSADELQQYLLKYRYYHPDVVVVHSGVNDALMTTDIENFQLDYSHSRRINFHLEPLAPPMRYLFRSYFISYISIALFFNNFSAVRDEYAPQSHQTYCNWSHLNIDSIMYSKQYDYYPFYQNIQNLLQTI